MGTEIRFREKDASFEGGNERTFEDKLWEILEKLS